MGKVFKFYGLRRIGETYQQAINLLPRKSRITLTLLTLLQCIIGLLELLSLYLITLVVTAGLTSVTGVMSGMKKNVVYPFIPSGLSSIQKTVLLGLAFLFVFVGKTILSTLLTLKTLTYLAAQTASISESLTGMLLTNDAEIVRFGRSQDHLAAVTLGVDALVIGILGGMSMVVSDVFTTVIILGVVILYNPVTAVVLIFLLTCSVFIITRFSNQIARNLSKRIAITNNKINREILDALSVYRDC